jgi:hypothetical protein
VSGHLHSVDPTNDREVPPLKGIYAGGSSEALGVVVEITQQMP